MKKRNRYTEYDNLIPKNWDGKLPDDFTQQDPRQRLAMWAWIHEKRLHRGILKTELEYAETGKAEDIRGRVSADVVDQLNYIYKTGALPFSTIILDNDGFVRLAVGESQKRKKRRRQQ